MAGAARLAASGAARWRGSQMVGRHGEVPMLWPGEHMGLRRATRRVVAGNAVRLAASGAARGSQQASRYVNGDEVPILWSISSSSPGTCSSSSRFSGHGNKCKHGDKPGRNNKGAPPGKGWQEIGVIEEEGLLDDEEHIRIMPKRCYYFLIFVLGFIALFSFFALVLWGQADPKSRRLS